MTLSTAVQPYWDDFNEDKQFYEILFRPSFAVQARELNQLQSILQKQIERHGRHVFAEGSMVIPGQITLELNTAYVKIESTYNGTSVESFLDELIDGNVELTGQTNGVKARVVHWEPATDTEPTTLYVRYVSSDTTTGTIKTFLPDELLVSDSTTPRTMQVQSVSVTPIGLGSTANIQRGVFFVNGRFVLVKAQTIVLDRYTSQPSYNVGLLINEGFVTPEEDSSLLDNSQGSTNFNAPGAHRYWIDLQLIKKAPNEETNKNFILLAKTTSGLIDKVITKTDYSEIEKTLARRTYDESGNYAVTPFNIQLREHRNNDRGAWAATTNYIKGDVVKSGANYYVAQNTGLSGTVAPTHTMGQLANGGVNFLYEPTPNFNNGVFTDDQGGDANFIAVGLEPGKAYVEGFEIEKLSTSYVKVPKARDYQSIPSGVIQPNLTSLVKITNVFGSLDTTKFLTVSLYDTYTSVQGSSSGTLVGTAKARYIELDSGTPGVSTTTYTLGLFDMQLNSGKKFEHDVRQIYFDNTSGVDFTADVVKQVAQLTGAITTTSTSPTVTGLGTSFTTELVPGESIRFYNGSTEVVAKILSIQSDTSLTLTANSGVTLSNVVFYSLMSEITDAGNDALIFPVSVPFVRTLRSNANPALSTTNYYTKQKFTDTCVSGAISITTSSSGDTFVSSADKTAFLVVNVTTGAILNPSSIVLNGGATTATITIGSGNNTNTIMVIAKVRRVLKERTKTMTRGFSEDFTTQSVVQAQNIALSNCDAQKLRKVVQFITTSTGNPIPFGSPIPGTGVTEIDITAQYILQGNQKDSYYDFSSIKMSPGAVFPNSPIRVYYDYYAHGNTGDFFSVDSYSSSAELPPLHRLSNGVTINLRDYIDFRPTRLTSTTWSSSFVPAIGEDFTTDYSYYLARRDSIVVDTLGNFLSVQGSPGENATDPHELANTMMLYKLDLTPATQAVDYSNIRVTRINNRRYTMKDIGDLDRRLQNVEYYTALNLLEEQTKNLQLFDANGNLQFKNGFLVDSFADMNIGDTNSNNYRCAIDTTARFMRPTFDITTVNLIEKSANNAERAAAGYQATGGLVTLPYTEVAAISQMAGSHMESVTPYIQLNFIGQMTLTPNSDDWHETSIEPDVSVNTGIVPPEKTTQNHDHDDKDPRKRFFKHHRHYHWWNHWQEVWVGRHHHDARHHQHKTRKQGDDHRDHQVVVYDPREDANRKHHVKHEMPVQIDLGTKVKHKKKSDGDTKIQLDVVPYMREQLVTFHATGMKPNTRVYPFFDTIDVSQYCTMADEVVVSTPTGDFDSTTDAGSESQHPARSHKDKKKPHKHLRRGDIIHNGAGGNINASTGTYVVLRHHHVKGQHRLHVHNKLGTISAGHTIHGSISGKQATVVSVTSPVDHTLMTNENGECVGIFTIPATSALRFRTGTRLFTLTDSTTNDKNWTTKATATYMSHGVIDPPVPSTRPPEPKPRTKPPRPPRPPVVSPPPGVDVVEDPPIILPAPPPVVSDPPVIATPLPVPPAPPAPPPSEPPVSPPAPVVYPPAPAMDPPAPAPAPVAQPAPAPAPTVQYYGEGNDWMNTWGNSGWTPDFAVQGGDGGDGGDPLAQSFSVPDNGVGMFVTSFDFYFGAKDKSLPVRLELREMLNGIPTTTVVPGSKATMLPDDITTSTNGSVATRFHFNQPIYLEPGKDYALVLSSDSVYYQVFVSQMGEDDLITGERIAKQPYLGSIFKSQNGSVWTPDQMLDMKFVMNRAKFDTSAAANVRFTNERLGADYLEANSVFTRSGTNKVRVFMKNHGHIAGSKVTISGVQSALNGIPAVELNAQFTVVAADFDSFVIQATTNATSTGYTGTTDILVTTNVRFDVVNLNMTQLVLPGTTIKHFVTTTRRDFTKKLFSVEIQPNQNVPMTENSFVLSEENETQFNSGYKSLDVYSQLVTLSDLVSPVLDLERVSMICVGNRIADAYAATNIAALDDNALGTSNLVSFSGATISTADATTKTKFLKARVGRILTTSGSANPANNVSAVITAVASDGSSITLQGVSFTTESTGATITFSVAEYFISEIAPEDGCADAKYVIKEMTLVDPADNLRVYFDVNMPSVASVDLYYRVSAVGAPKDQMVNSNWTLVQPNAAIATYEDPNTFFGADYTITPASAFDKAQIKIVMRSTESALVPTIKQLRLIAAT
jgi:hypothetical protein